MTIRVGVFGAGGRMGRTVCAAVAADPDLELVGAVDPHHAGLDGKQVTGVDVPGLHVDRDPTAMLAQRVDVVVDFTHLEASRENLAWAARHGVHAVVGTTGFTSEDHDRLREEFTDSNCIIAPNFAIGAVLMMRFAAEASKFMPRAEIIELHHDTKLDKPSGTAKHTAERMEGEVPIHSVRLPGLVAHQEVILGAQGQTLTIRHDSTDRTSFVPGVLLAVRRVMEQEEPLR
ncbi:MAG TPA: 4-hydroxy-tetrahydrodipicolinate reductase, partial [Microthrixaceae bacterium]|nr:4-hydroxy-tetrahydrodipicolinate reductase [Microthrixaceae bacterium]